LEREASERTAEGMQKGKTIDVFKEKGVNKCGIKGGD
jgi:hypothetical protein